MLHFEELTSSSLERQSQRVANPQPLREEKTGPIHWGLGLDGYSSLFPQRPRLRLDLKQAH